MLHIERKNGEAITIDGGITIKIIEVRGHHVRIGIDAPRNIGVYRTELYERIRAENELASKSVDSIDHWQPARKKGDEL